jgi:hypothetical protein
MGVFGLRRVLFDEYRGYSLASEEADVPIEMALWRLEGDKGIPVRTSSMDTERRLEDILENDIGILGLGQLLIIGRQVPTRFGKFIDLLAMSSSGEMYIIELKRDRTPREVVAQALDYGSWVRELGYEDIAELFSAYAHETGFDEAQQDAFGEIPEELNGSHHLVIVASDLDPSTERIRCYLGDFEVPINVVFFRYLNDDGNEYLARSWLVDPREAESRPTRKHRPTETHEQTKDRVASDFVRAQVDELDGWFESLAPGVAIRHGGGSDHGVRVEGKRVLAYYFAQRWVHFWLADRTEHDFETLSGLSDPASVKESGGGVGFNVATKTDLDLARPLIAKRVQVTIADGP